MPSGKINDFNLNGIFGMDRLGRQHAAKGRLLPQFPELRRLQGASRAGAGGRRTCLLIQAKSGPSPNHVTLFVTASTPGRGEREYGIGAT